MNRGVLRLPATQVQSFLAADDAEYVCNCAGYQYSDVARMCLRCLEAYSGGLPAIYAGAQLQEAMVLVAHRLAELIARDDPDLTLADIRGQAERLRLAELGLIVSPHGVRV